MSRTTTKKGSLEVICGPMFSGKSEELIRRLRRAEIAQQHVAVFKHAIDDRYDIHNVTSHNGMKLPAHATENGSHLFAKVEREDYTVVGIDEIHFYTYDIIPAICKLVERGVRVISAGLDMDYRGVPFRPLPTLLAIADSITKLKAICTQCGADAHFSQILKTTDSGAKNDEPFVLVGTSDTFTARCRACHDTDYNFNYDDYHQAHP